ncbi:MAG: hypothetical protein EAX86_12855 [Candidatus Heimdallarchaeota archaeon]|nr:hypothetical protein [Candidatus Heimdallarchaeota archaeon]
MTIKEQLGLSTRLRGYFLIVRPINGTLSGFTVLIGAIAALSSPLNEAQILGIIIGCLTTSLLAMGGYTINDVYDIEIDKINTPHRPLPAGMLSLKEARTFAIILFVIGTSITLFIPNIPIPSFLLAIFGGLLLYFYAALFKRTGFLGNVVVAILVAIPFLFGGILTQSFETFLFPASFAFLINLGREIIKDIEDVRGDELKDVKSLALLYGIKPARNIGFVVLFSMIFIVPIPILLGYYTSPIFIFAIFLIISFIFYSAYLMYSVSEQEIIKSASKVKKILKFSMGIGVIGFVAQGITKIIETSL